MTTPRPTLTDSLSLSELRDCLATAGIDIHLSALSAWLNTGDIAEQLGIGGKGNRKEIPPATAPMLIGFWPIYQDLGRRRDKAPDLLRRYLEQLHQHEGQLVPVRDSFQALETRNGAATEPTARELAEAQGRAEGLARADDVLSAEEAATFLRVSVSMLRKHVNPSFRIGKSARGDRWYKRDLLSL